MQLPTVYDHRNVYDHGGGSGGGDIDILYYSFFDNTDVSTGETTPIIGDTQNLFDYGTGFTLSKSNETLKYYPVQKNVLTVTANQSGNVGNSCRLFFNDNKSLCIKIKANIYAPNTPSIFSYLWLRNNLTGLLSITKHAADNIQINTRGVPQYYNGAYYDHDISPYIDSVIPNTTIDEFHEFKIILNKKTNKVYVYVDNVIYLSFDFVFSNHTDMNIDPRNLGYISVTELLVFESDLIENEL